MSKKITAFGYLDGDGQLMLSTIRPTKGQVSSNVRTQRHGKRLDQSRIVPLSIEVVNEGHFRMEHGE